MNTLKKQQKTAILLVGVIIVWGLIGYTIYKRFNPPDPVNKVPMINGTFFKGLDTTIVFYEVSAGYRDPFLGRYPQKKKEVRSKQKNSPPKIEVVFPNVVYNGIISGNNTTSFIFTINGQQEILKIGETFAEVKLIKANAQEARVLFKGVSKSFLLEE